MALSYKKVSGSLPIGVSINKDGSVKGFLDFENVDLNPIWVTPSGNLGTVDEQTYVEFDAFEATPRPGRYIDSYCIVEKNIERYNLIPFGLTLNSQTGVISGTLIEQGGKLTEKTWYDGDEPQWITNSGDLGTFDELDEGIVIELFAESPVESTIYYHITDGTLPSGLTLDSLSGDITGDILPLVKNDLIDINVLYKRPIWVSPSGSLGNYNEFDEVSVNVVAASRNGLTQMYYGISKGTLPSGLTLNSLTGEISGTCLELRELNVPFYNFGNAPIISNTVKVNGNDLTVLDDEIVLSTAVNENVNIKFSATPYGDRQIETYFISIVDSETLPFGLVLNPLNGEISGTVLSTNPLGEYPITLGVVDTKGVFSRRKYKIVIEQGEE